MLFAIRASVELEVTDFVTVEKIVKAIFFFPCLFKEIKKSPPFFSPLSISLYLGRHIRENFDINKKTFFQKHKTLCDRKRFYDKKKKTKKIKVFIEDYLEKKENTLYSFD